MISIFGKFILLLHKLFLCWYNHFMTIKYEIQQEPFLWVDVEINNFKHFKETIESWSDMDFIQLDEGAFHSELKQIIFPEIQITYATYNCHLDQQGRSLPKDTSLWRSRTPRCRSPA